LLFAQLRFAEATHRRPPPISSAGFRSCSASLSRWAAAWVCRARSGAHFMTPLGPALLELELEAPDDALLPLFDQ